MRKIFLLFATTLFCGVLCAEKIVVPKHSCSGKPGSVLNVAVPFRSNFTINGVPGKKPLAQFLENGLNYLGIIL